MKMAQPILARGWPSDHRNLETHGVRSIWLKSERYLGEVPGDIAEYLDDHGKRSEFDSGSAL
jgi:hypothetical protein